MSGYTLVEVAAELQRQSRQGWEATSMFAQAFKEIAEIGSLEEAVGTLRERTGEYY
jgi:hypothetical protein